jgi:hypothetical protein
LRELLHVFADIPISTLSSAILVAGMPLRLNDVPWIQFDIVLQRKSCNAQNGNVV